MRIGPGQGNNERRKHSDGGKRDTDHIKREPGNDEYDRKEYPEYGKNTNQNFPDLPAPHRFLPFLQLLLRDLV